jgi:hypothetical protein
MENVKINGIPSEVEGSRRGTVDTATGFRLRFASLRMTFIENG